MNPSKRSVLAADREEGKELIMAKIRAAKMGGGETVAYDKYIGVQHGSGASNFAYSYVDLTQQNTGTAASGVTTYTSPEGVKLSISSVNGYYFTLNITPPTGKTVDIEFISSNPNNAISLTETISAVKSITAVNRYGVLFYKVNE